MVDLVNAFADVLVMDVQCSCQLACDRRILIFSVFDVDDVETIPFRSFLLDGGPHCLDANLDDAKLLDAIRHDDVHVEIILPVDHPNDVDTIHDFDLDATNLSLDDPSLLLLLRHRGWS